MVGERIGRYRVLRRLATGGMAEIYLARLDGPKGFNKLVVIKWVLPAFASIERFVEMFLDEARLAARLSHPNIAQTFELGEQDGRYHLAMEYISGESLHRMVRRAKDDGRPVPEACTLRMVMQLLEALDYAHDLKGERGEWLKVVHRDVTPANLVVSYHGGVKLLDFGIARAASNEHRTLVGTVKGKSGYMSPEQAQAGLVDCRTDVFAAGALLYLLATGGGPFEGFGDAYLMLRATVEGRFPKPSEKAPGISPKLEQIILKAMASRRDDRYSTAGAMLQALEEYAAEQRLYPSARELATYMRQLFPDRADLALSWEQEPSVGLVDRLAESFSDVEPREVHDSAPTLRARRVGGLITGATEEAVPVTAEPDPGERRVENPTVPSVALSDVLSEKALAQLSRSKPTASLRAAVPALGESEDRTVQVPSVREAEGQVSGVRPTTPANPLFEAVRPVPPVLRPAPPLDRTISAEAELGAPPDDAKGGTLVGLVPDFAGRRPVGFQAQLAKNPLPYVLAGFGAVMVGVFVLWLLVG